jgi:flagella synthesis protein FlgN
MVSADVTVANCLSQELGLAGRLHALLRDEEAALLNKDIDALQATTQDKARLAREFAQVRQQRLVALQQAGLPASDDSMSAWVRRQADTAVQQQWQELRRLASSSQELNRANGDLIQRLSVLNQAALSVLQAHRKTDLYGPSGHNTGPTSFRGVVA